MLVGFIDISSVPTYNDEDLRSKGTFVMSHLSPATALLALAPAYVCLAALAPCFAQTPAVPATAQLAVPEGTQVHLTLLKSIKSGGNKAGEQVPFEVAKDVYSPNRTLLIAADTPAFGKILESSRRGMFGKSGKLKFTIDYILAPDKTHIPLRSDAQILRGRDNRTASVATAILLAPVAIFINGKDVSADKGQDFVMYVDTTTAFRQPSVIPPMNSPAVTAAQSLFVLANGTQVQGTLVSFDGSRYTVSTAQGTVLLQAADVKSVYALAPASGTTTSAPK